MLYFVRVGAPVYRRAWEVLGGTGKICATGKTVLRVRPRTLTNKRGRDVDQGENLKERRESLYGPERFTYCPAAHLCVTYEVEFQLLAQPRR